ncbi:MAG: ADP-ribosylation factor-like protein [Promethearchaeota archaeon]
MVRWTADHNIYIKILYWGMGGSGKTTLVDSLYRLTKEQKKDITPTGNLTKISMASGSTLYFDRGIFQSTKQNKVYYHVYTVAGQSRFSPLRKKIFKGTDGVIFVVDSQTHFFEDNIESLNLITMLNKQDLNETIGEEDFKQVLKEEKLWYEPDHELYIWNPIIYKSCALYEKKMDVYRSFTECARRTGLYQIYGDGKAPVGDNFSRDIPKF